MTQPADITLSNQSGASYRTEHNSINQGFGTNHKGGSEPSYVVTGMTWIDDTTTPWLWNIFDGAASFAFMEVNPSTNNVTLVNVKDGDARTEGASIGQIQDSTTKWGGTSGGTDTVTITLTPAITAYADGQRFAFLAGGANTGAATLNVNGVGAKALEKRGAALAANDIAANDIVEVIYDSTNDAFQVTSPIITTSASGGLVLLATATASASATISFTSGIDSTYDEYILKAIGAVPSVDNRDLYLLTTTNATDFDVGASDYKYGADGLRDDGTVLNFNSSGTTQIVIADGVGNAAGESCNATIHLFAPSNAALKTKIQWASDSIDGDDREKNATGSGRRDAAEDVDGIRFLFNTGNITSGLFLLFGVVKSL